jgi:primosomal protein N'
LRTFLEDPNGILVSTRLGAWMGIVSDTIIVEEPENDDFKQDEMAPRLDARRVVETIHTLKPSIRIFRISTTPSLEEGKTTSWNAVPHLTPDIRLEPTTRQGRSPVANLSAQTLHEIHEAADNGNPVIIVHPIRGERARVTCRDCAWQAHCPACGFPVSLVADTELCRRCGKRSPVSLNCPACGGLDLSRGRAGIDTLSRDLVKHIGTSDIHVLNIPEWEAAHLTPNTLVVITDLSLFAGAIEDIRRRERLVIAWRRSAARIMTANARAIIQGGEELLQECRGWLTNLGVSAVWEQEWQERGSFRFPPAIRLVKILVDGEASKAEELMAALEPTLGPAMSLRGPYPVPFRPRSRLPRHVVHLIAPKETPYSTLAALLAPIVGKAHIDLDPINCFS